MKQHNEQAPELIHGIPLATDRHYYEWVEEIKARYHAGQVKAAIRVNTEMLRFYWHLGYDISRLKAESRWGAGVVRRLSKDLRNAFPKAHGFSESNIKYAARWFRFYNSHELIGQRVVDQFEMPEAFGEVPWGQHIEIVSRCNSVEEAMFYVNEVAANGWSRPTLVNKIKAGLYRSQGQSINNFPERLPSKMADNAKAILKDPYCFDFLQLPDEYDEKTLEDALVANITRFIMELGKGFAFVGRQIELRMPDNTSYYPDLLFYNFRLKCFVVCELKVGKFKPEYAGKLNFYVKAVDELMKGDDDNQSIGLLICSSKDKTTVEWSLSDIQKPLGVASYELEKAIESSLKAMLYNRNGDSKDTL